MRDAIVHSLARSAVALVGPAAVLVASLAVSTFQPAGAMAACVGDCGDDGAVTVNELVTMVNIGLGSIAASACLAGDADGDGSIGIDEIITGASHALNGCGASPSPTPACAADTT